MSKRTFRMFVEEELGELPHFIVGAILEWLLIASIFIHGFLALLYHKFATTFGLDPPCVLCTRMDQSLVDTNPNSYHNNPICESHKKDISLLAYCHVHRKLSDIRTMCDGCLLSFQTDKDASNPSESKVGLKPLKTGKETSRVVEMSTCSCCGESFKKRTSSKAFVRTPSNLRASMLAPPLSPRVPLTPIGWRKNDNRNAELPHVMYTELKLFSGDEPDVPEDASYEINAACSKNVVKEDIKSTTPFLPYLEESAITPRFADKLTKKLQLEKPDLDLDSNDETPEEGDSALHHLKRQIRSDKRMLMVLHQELNEERNASAVAANNSMAMITKLQTEKASIEMEALQYQRMMEEQAEYDQEAIQILKDMLIQKEKDIRVMEIELQSYKERYGEIKKLEISDGSDDNHYKEVQSSQEGDEKRVLDFETERYRISDMLNNLENLIQSSSDAADHQDKDKGKEKKASLKKEMSIIKEKMSAIEAESGYLKNTTVTLQKGDERAHLLTEIAQNLRRLRT